MHSQQARTASRAAVFLDRDDTLIECNGLPPAPPPAQPGDLVDPSLVRLLPGVLDGCRSLSGAGFDLVVVSNQGCIARGAATCETVEAVNERVRALLVDEFGRGLIRAVYFCPFHPRGRAGWLAQEHDWRKPSGGMLCAAAHELGVVLTRSWLIGDAARDIEAGINAGLRPERCLRVGGGVDFAAAAARVLAQA